MTYNQYEYNRRLENRGRGTTEAASSEYRRYLEKSADNAGREMALRAGSGTEYVGNSTELGGLSEDMMTSVIVATDLMADTLGLAEVAPRTEEGIEFSFDGDQASAQFIPDAGEAPTETDIEFDFEIEPMPGVVDDRRASFAEKVRQIVDAESDDMVARGQQVNRADDIVREQFEPRIRNPYQQTSGNIAGQLGPGQPAIDDLQKDESFEYFVNGNERHLSALHNALRLVADALVSHANAIDELQDIIREATT